MCHACKFSGRVIAVFFHGKTFLKNSKKIVLLANVNRNSCSACICVLLICVEYNIADRQATSIRYYRMDNTILAEL